ncbi:MAG: ornithine carbamoyltransferase [Firmicutes bacterium]|nr:ornithine carbamoyltransferase [Bacillota bacterium]
MDINAYKAKGKINNRHLLTLVDYSTCEIFEILKLGQHLKFLLNKGKKHTYLKDKTLAMIFAKSSTRTRVSFEQGIRQLGGVPMFLSSSDIQLGRGEPISDTVKTLERYNVDGIMIRTFKQSDVSDLAKFGTIPIINGLTDDFHPCQALADILTVYERFGKLDGVRLAYFGDGNNVANSLMVAGAKTGMDIVICSPKSNAPNAEIVAEAQKFGKVTLTESVDEAARGADVIYTDVFFSMGQETDAKKQAQLLAYQVNTALMEKAEKHAIFMHCLPAHRGEEVSAEVIDGPQSVVFEQAENRLHAQKAVMTLLMK